MCKRNYLFPEEVEKEMQDTRDVINFNGETEKIIIKNLVESAKVNSRIGDKVLMVINPAYVHFPSWQRFTYLSQALKIGNNYDPLKWEVPKVWYHDGLLYGIDGKHRIYGAYKGKIESVVVEIIECTLEKAIDLFINQTNDRTRILPRDIYVAALAGGKEDYIILRDICHSHNVAVKGDKGMENTVGTLTSISDGIHMVHNNPKLLDSMLALLGNLEWNGYADSYNGKAYTAKIIRALKALYAYFEGRTDEMEAALLEHCKGTEYFVENIMDKTQAQIFDYLSEIVRYEMESPFTEKKRTTKLTKKSTKAKVM